MARSNSEPSCLRPVGLARDSGPGAPERLCPQPVIATASANAFYGVTHPRLCRGRVLNGIELSLAALREISGLGQVLPEQSVGVRARRSVGWRSVGQDPHSIWMGWQEF